METSQTNATNVTLLLLGQAIWGHIWKRTVGKIKTNATNVTLHPFRQAIWGDTWECTVEKSQTNATNVTLHLLGQAIWGHTCYTKIPKNTGILFSKIPVSVFESNPGIPVFSGIPQGPGLDWWAEVFWKVMASYHRLTAGRPIKRGEHESHFENLLQVQVWVWVWINQQPGLVWVTISVDQLEDGCWRSERN